MWKDLFSIDERRMSALIAGFFITLMVYLGLIAVSVFTHFVVVQYIMDSLSSTLGSLTFGVVGGGGVQALKSYADYKQNMKACETDSTSTATAATSQSEAGPL